MLCETRLSMRSCSPPAPLFLCTEEVLLFAVVKYTGLDFRSNNGWKRMFWHCLPRVETWF